LSAGPNAASGKNAITLRGAFAAFRAGLRPPAAVFAGAFFAATFFADTFLAAAFLGATDFFAAAGFFAAADFLAAADFAAAFLTAFFFAGFFFTAIASSRSTARLPFHIKLVSRREVCPG